MANSKIPNLGLGDTLNSQRLKFNQLLDSIGDISSLTAGTGGLVSALNAVDSNLGTVDSNMGTDARTLGGAIRELNDRLDSIQTTELLSPSATLSDSSATNIVRGGLQVDTNLHVGGNTTISGSLRVDGIATLNAGPDGNINIGDSGDSDTVTVNAEFASSLIPDTDGIYDIGDSAKKWNRGYFTSVDFGSISADSAIYTGNLTVQGLTTVDSINSTHLFVSDSTKLSGMMDVYATPTFYSATTFKDSISVTGNITTPAAASVGSLVVDSSFTVNGITNLDSVNVVGPLDVTGVLTVSQDFSVGGTFTVVGAQLTEASFYQVLSNQALDSGNRGGLSVFRQGTDSAILQWNEAGDYWEAGINDSLNNDIVNRLALQNDSAAFSRIYQTGTGALRLPAGTTSQRPSDSAGASVNGYAKEGEIRFNQTNSNFEGFDGTGWSGFGGIIDADQDTKIIAAKNGSDSDTLTFITGGVERARLNDSGMHVTPTLNATTVAATVVTADSATFTKINVPTLGTSTIDVDSATFDKIVIDTSVAGGGIRSVDGGEILIAADSGAEGIPHIKLQSLNSGFDEGKITLFASGDIRLDALNSDIEIDGTNIWLGDEETEASRRGLHVRPDVEGGYITSIAVKDSSYITMGPYIDFYHTPDQPYGSGSRVQIGGDSIHIKRAGLYVEDTLNQGSKFDGDVTVVGNLTVSGTTTSVNSTQVELGDRIIELNSEIDSAATPTQDAGIEINRGIKDNAQFLFDESEKYWVAGEGDSNTKARVVTTNYLKFPGNDALSLDSATGTISHTGRNIPTIDASGGVKALNAVFDSNGHVTSFTVTEGGALTTDSVSGLSISGANDSAISIDSAGLVKYFIEKAPISRLVVADESDQQGAFSKLRIDFGNKDKEDQRLEIFTNPGDPTGDEIVIRARNGTDDSGAALGNLKLAGAIQSTSSDILTSYNGDLLLEGEQVGARSDQAIYLLPGYADFLPASNAGTRAASGFVEIAFGTNFDDETDPSQAHLPGRYGQAYSQQGSGSCKFIPGKGGIPSAERFIMMADGDLIIRNNPDDGDANDDIYFVSNSGEFYFRKDNADPGEFGDDDPDLEIAVQDTSFGVGPSGSGHTVFYNDDSATMSLGLSGTFTIKSNVAHSTSYKTSANTLGAGNGATLTLWGSEGSPTDNGIIGEVRFAAENSLSEDVPYAGIVATSKDISNNTEDGRIQIFTRQAGTMTKQAEVTETGEFIATGDVTAFSDVRLKDNIETIDNALDKVSSLRGVYFDRDGERGTGVIAQEVEEVLPEVVHDGEDYKSVAYGNMVGVLIEAIKELKAEIEELKNDTLSSSK